MTHLFLTGDKQVGKSTIIRRLLEGERRLIGGFFTVKTDGVWPGRSSVHLLRAGTREVPSPQNWLFFCDRVCGDTALSRFNLLGCAALAERPKAELVLMDELGPMEARAERFQEAVFQILNGDVPVLGVLQRADSEFLDRVRRHEKVEVIQVTLENRDRLLRELLQRQMDG